MNKPHAEMGIKRPNRHAQILRQAYVVDNLSALRADDRRGQQVYQLPRQDDW